jgi:hypothetical protein
VSLNLLFILFDISSSNWNIETDGRSFYTFTHQSVTFLIVPACYVLAQRSQLGNKKNRKGLSFQLPKLNIPSNMLILLHTFWTWLFVLKPLPSYGLEWVHIHSSRWWMIVYSEHWWPATQPLKSQVVTVCKHLLLTLKTSCLLPRQWIMCVIWLSQ